MAEEDFKNQTTTTDDMTVLNVLLHEIRGISPVSTTDFVMVPADASDEAAAITYNN